MGEIRALTGLRGIAALYVILFHFDVYTLFEGRLRMVASHGYLSVDLFFVLSGFVMALVYQSLFDKGVDTTSFKFFMARRIARIYPLYICVTLLAIGMIVFGDANQTLNSKQVISNLFLVQSWGIGNSYIGPAWSISTEWAAYMVFPFIVAYIPHRSFKVNLLLGALFLFGLAVIANLPGDIVHRSVERMPLGLWEGHSIFPLLRCVLEFILGITAFRIFNFEKVKGFIKSKWLSLFMAGLLVAGLSFPKSDVFVVAIMPLLIISLMNEKGYGAKILGWAPIHWLGLISYSLYLTHGLISDFINSLALPYSTLTMILVKTVICLFMAEITYRGIEKPGRRLFRHWFETRKKAPVQDDNNFSPA